MENTKKDILLKEHLMKIKHRFDYKINESPTYRQLIGNNEQFDEYPQLTNEAGEEENIPNPQGEMPPAGETPPEMGAPAGETPPPTGEEMPPVDANAMDSEVPPIEGQEGEMGMDANAQNPEQQVDDIQNEIIKHNIEAMKSIHDQLEGLNSTVQSLNVKLNELNADVEEVREPTNTEKLMSKTNVSYPYYFNLNDFWSGNWFNQKREEENEKGVRELPDGTFIADFDELPQQSKTDVQNSFNQFD